MTDVAHAPGPRINVLLQPTSLVRRQAHRYLCQLEQRYGDVSRVKFGPFNVVFICHPDYIEYIFLHRDKYIKVQEGGMLRHLLGNGLLTSEGDFWLKQRRLIQPVFHKHRLYRFVNQIATSTAELMATWEQHMGKTIDGYQEMNKLTLDIVGKTLFSTNVKGESDKVNRALTQIMKAIRNRSRMMRLPLWVPLPSHLCIRHNRDILDETIAEIVQQRRDNRGNFDDLLTMLMEVEDADTAERMTDRQLRDEVLTLFIAGHETTANTLAFTLYLLARHPEVKERVLREIRDELPGGDITFDQLQRLTYLTMVIKESMRLYPPAWIIPREATADDVLGGYRVKKGDKVMASPYAMHHSERYWKEPEVFNPERFAPEHLKEMPRYAYFPFGGGQRMCIGNNFAMMEMQIVLAMLLPRFDYQLPDGFILEILPLITLRPKFGVPMKLISRKV